MSNLVLIAFVFLFCLNSRGLGGPVTKRKGMLISDYLQELTTKCTNSFLAPEISKALESCSIKPPDSPDLASEKQILCAMYYEINSKLCNSSLQEADFAHKYGQDVMIKDLCTDSMQWTVNDIPWYPLYQISMEGLFKDKISCSSLCHDPNRLYHTNNVCKLYKVGYELLHETKAVTITDVQDKDKTPKKLEFSDSNESEPQLVIHRDTVPADVLSRKTIEDAYLAHSSVANPSEIVNPQSNINKETPVTKTNEQSQVSSQAKNEQASVLGVDLEQLDVSNKVDKVRGMLKQINGPPISNVQQPTITTKKPEEVLPDRKPPPVDPINNNDPNEPNIPQDDDEPGEEIDQDKEKVGKIADQVPQSFLENDSEKQKNNWEVHGVKDEDENMLINGPLLGDLGLEETNLSKLKTPARAPDSAHAGGDKLPESIQKVLFPSQPEFPSDDEDHFFSFFLTVIVVVALLYILYHNKSKVTKVVMGLIVEGRQPGRRRNSRGHAYKRLDTLEQAMSTTATAPPSKIIY